MSCLFNALQRLIVVGFLTLSACTWKQASQPQQPVVKVGAAELSAKEFANQLAHRLSKYDALTAKDPKNVSRVKEALIDDFILSSILQQWAQANKIQVNKAALEDEYKKIRMGFPDDLVFREELSKQGISVHEWQKSVERRLLEQAAMENIQRKTGEPTEVEIGKYYESNKQKYNQKERVFIQQIVLAENSDADQIQAALKKNQSFESLAKQFSITPEAKTGGTVGWVERGTLDIFDKAFELPVGSPSETLQSPYGFHILLVTKKMPAGLLPLANVHDAIKRELKGKMEQAYFSTWLENQIRSLHVFKNQQLIDSMAVETRKD